MSRSSWMHQTQRLTWSTDGSLLLPPGTSPHRTISRETTKASPINKKTGTFSPQTRIIGTPDIRSFHFPLLQTPPYNEKGTFSLLIRAFLSNRGSALRGSTGHIYRGHLVGLFQFKSFVDRNELPHVVYAEALSKDFPR